MKTLEERAQQAMGVHLSSSNPVDRLAVMTHLMKEVARDQRHVCAEHTQGELVAGGANLWATQRAHTACMNAPEPGKPTAPTR